MSRADGRNARAIAQSREVHVDRGTVIGLVAVGVLFAAVAVWVGSRVARNPDWVWKCERFLYAGLIFEGVFLLATSILVTATRDPAIGMLFGMLVAIPAGIVGLACIAFTFVAIRVRYVYRVLLPILVVFPLAIPLIQKPPWDTVLIALWGAFLLVAAWRGWRATRRGPPAPAEGAELPA